MTEIQSIAEVTKEGEYSIPAIPPSTKPFQFKIIIGLDDRYYISIKSGHVYYEFTNNSATNVYTTKKLSTLLNKIASVYNLSSAPKAANGLLVGARHSGGGIQIKTPEGFIEAEGGEIVVNRINSARYCELLSKINSDGGHGVVIPCDEKSIKELKNTFARGAKLADYAKQRLIDDNKSDYLKLAQEEYDFKLKELSENGDVINASIPIADLEPHFEYEGDDFSAIEEGYKRGEEINPLVVAMEYDVLSIRDGNHRLMAMKNLGYKTANVKITKDDYDKYIANNSAGEPNATHYAALGLKLLRPLDKPLIQIINEIEFIIAGNGRTGQADSIQSAAEYTKRNGGAGEPDSKGIRATGSAGGEKAALINYAKSNKLWIPRPLHPPIASGAEQDVYRIGNGTHVLKFNSCAHYKSWLDYFISLQLHNYFFATTRYELIGFNYDGENLYAVVRQQYIKTSELASINEIGDFMRYNGFEEYEGIANLWYLREAPYFILSDLNVKNVLEKGGIPFFIDSVFEVTEIGRTKIRQKYDGGEKAAMGIKIDINKTKYEIQHIISGDGQVGDGGSIQAAASYLRASKGAGSAAESGSEIKRREAEKLKKYASDNGLWIKFSMFSNNRIGAGSEQKVFLIGDSHVVKINSATYYESWQDYFDSLLLHNYFFPRTAYKLIGFIEFESTNTLYAVVEQKFVVADAPTDLTLVKEFMKANGFEVVKDNDYFNKELDIKLEDLHDENVLTENGALQFIDTVFYIGENKHRMRRGGIVVTAEQMLNHPKTKQAFKEIEADDSWKDRFLAKTENYKPNIYYHVQNSTGGGQAGVGYGLYLGRDKNALVNFYDIEEDGKPVDIYLGNEIKWWDLIRYEDYKAAQKEAIDKFGKKEWIGDYKHFNDIGDTMRKLALKKGFDGIRYYDPQATGEEFVLYNVDDATIQKLALGGFVYKRGGTIPQSKVKQIVALCNLVKPSEDFFESEDGQGIYIQFKQDLTPYELTMIDFHLEDAGVNVKVIQWDKQDKKSIYIKLNQTAEEGVKIKTMENDKTEWARLVDYIYENNIDEKWRPGTKEEGRVSDETIKTQWDFLKRKFDGVHDKELNEAIREAGKRRDSASRGTQITEADKSATSKKVSLDKIELEGSTVREVRGLLTKLQIEPNEEVIVYTNGEHYKTTIYEERHKLFNLQNQDVNAGILYIEMRKRAASLKEKAEFVDYCYSFYGKGDNKTRRGIYAKDFNNGGFTKEEIENAVDFYIHAIKNHTLPGEPEATWGGGDSIDRERVRYILDPEETAASGAKVGALPSAEEREKRIANLASAMTDDELGDAWSAYTPTEHWRGNEDDRAHFKVYHKELIKRERDPKSKYYIGDTPNAEEGMAIPPTDFYYLRIGNIVRDKENQRFVIQSHGEDAIRVAKYSEVETAEKQTPILYIDLPKWLGDKTITIDECIYENDRDKKLLEREIEGIYKARETESLRGQNTVLESKLSLSEETANHLQSELETTKTALQTANADLESAKQQITELGAKYEKKVSDSNAAIEGLATLAEEKAARGKLISTPDQKRAAIRKFIAKFPLNAKSWGQATDELPDLHKYMTEVFNDGEPKKLHKFPEDRSKTPAELNKRHRKGIEELLGRMTDRQIDQTYSRFEHWFNEPAAATTKDKYPIGLILRDVNDDLWYHVDFIEEGAVHLSNASNFEPAKVISEKQLEALIESNKEGGLMAGGGKIKNQYEGKTAEQVWASWDRHQRAHFISDHLDPNLSVQEVSRLIPIKLAEHVKGGQYEGGGRVVADAVPDIYKKEFKLKGNRNRKYNIFQSHGTSELKQAAKQITPDMDYAEHKKLAAEYKHLSEVEDKKWLEVVQSEFLKLFGKPYHLSDYKISGIAREEFSDEVKMELRRIVDKGNQYRQVFHFHNAQLKAKDKLSYKDGGKVEHMEWNEEGDTLTSEHDGHKFEIKKTGERNDTHKLYIDGKEEAEGWGTIASCRSAAFDFLDNKNKKEHGGHVAKTEFGSGLKVKFEDDKGKYRIGEVVEHNEGGYTIKTSNGKEYKDIKQNAIGIYNKGGKLNDSPIKKIKKEGTNWHVRMNRPHGKTKFCKVPAWGLVLAKSVDDRARILTCQTDKGDYALRSVIIKAKNTSQSEAKEIAEKIAAKFANRDR